MPGENTTPENADTPNDAANTTRDEQSEAEKEQGAPAHELNSQADVISTDDAG